MSLRDLTFYLKNRPIGDALLVESVEADEIKNERVAGRDAYVVVEEDSTITTIFAGEIDALSNAPHKPAQEEEETPAS